MTLIVDGYNAVHAWPELSALLTGGDTATARARLIAILSEHAAATGDAVTVVFDAGSRTASEPERVDGVTVRFGSHRQSADHIIERLVYQARHRGEAQQITVATDDRLQRDMVRSMGAAVMGIAQLRAETSGSRRTQTDVIDTARQGAELSRRLEDRLDEATRRALERLRRGETE